MRLSFFDLKKIFPRKTTMNLKSTQLSNKEVAEEYANKIWNDKEINTIDRLVHQNVLIHSLLGDFYGTKAMRDVVQAWLKGFPNLRVDNHIIIGEADLVSIQWQAKGTHQGEFKAIKPTGNPVSYSGVTVYRMNEGKIVEYWAYLDMQHLLGQLLLTQSH
jgi:predicted ester cyclase